MVPLATIPSAGSEGATVTLPPMLLSSVTLTFCTAGGVGVPPPPEPPEVLAGCLHPVKISAMSSTKAAPKKANALCFVFILKTSLLKLFKGKGQNLPAFSLTARIRGWFTHRRVGQTHPS